MKPAPFRYHRPQSLGEALALLSEHSDAKLIAGGQSLGPMMNMRLVQPAELIDLNAVAGLDSIAEKGNFLEIGALARHHAIAGSSLVKNRCPLLAEAAQAIGHYAIRSRGTLGGSLAHADPAAQLPLVAATLGAEIVVNGKRGERRIAAKDFFVSMMTTALEPDEILVCVRFPKASPGERHAYLQFSRRTGDFAIVAVAVALHSPTLTLGIGGAEDKPLVLDDLNAAEKPEVIARKAREAVNPTESPRVPALYRKELVEVLVKRAVARCLTSS
ncbi:MAG: carbon monoxide dehydrogenase [Burkholderiales bacterium]|jgi:carbon-monoxide dehydrogenase medium subunit|nr:carbon monoxide dehydrogenase [Burkholderiales bacterium]